jgi:hypothetical protein
MSYLLAQTFCTWLIWYLCSPPPYWVLATLGAVIALTGILVYAS